MLKRLTAVAAFILASQFATADLLFSSDGGATWTAAGLAGVPVEDIVPDPSDPKTALALTGGSKPGLHRTTDAGRTWRDITPPFGPECAAIDPAASRTLVAAGYEGAFARSTDGGISWKTGSIGDAASSTMMKGVLKNVRALAFSGKRLLAAGGQGDGFAAASDDDGATWTALDWSEGWGYNWALAVAKNALLVGGDNGLAASADGGKTFARIPGVKPCLGVGGRFAVSPDALRIVYSFRGQVVASADGGKTFAPLAGPEGTFLAAAAWSGKTMVAVAQTGKLQSEGDMTFFTPDGKASLVASEDGKGWKAAGAAVKQVPEVIAGTRDEKGLWLGTK